jgi:hypothetical protein
MIQHRGVDDVQCHGTENVERSSVSRDNRAISLAHVLFSMFEDEPIPRNALKVAL